MYCPACGGEREEPHRHCSQCGVIENGGLCAYHHFTLAGDEWAVSNRIMCDLLHRGTVPARVPREERLIEVEIEG